MKKFIWEKYFRSIVVKRNDLKSFLDLLNKEVEEDNKHEEEKTK